MDDEDGDFTFAAGSARSRLSSLFQKENSTGDINQALMFTAPKQPKKNDNTQGTAGTLKLIHAVVIHAYKLKDGNYTNQGRLGCAILGHHESSSYKLLLYKGKQMQVTVTAITPNFTFHVQPNNYANFYDEKKENWSINFDSEAALFDFSKQVALAKANCQGKSTTTLVIQDVINGEGQPLENGDTAEVKYTGWLLSNFSFGQVFDSNMNSESLYRIRLGKSKVIKGWSEGLIGGQKGSKRLLIIPSDLAYGAEGMGSTIPPNSTLIFEIHVVKVKHAREVSHSPSPIKVPETTAPPPPPEKKPDVPQRQSFSQEDNIRMRGASISEQLSQSPKKDKAQLISRMAKMGTATLPFQGAVPAQVSSDSESEPEAPQPTSPAPQSISGTSSPKSFTKSRSRHSSGPTTVTQPVQPQAIQAAAPFHMNQQSSQVSLYAQSAMPTQQSYVCAATPFPTYPSPMASQFSIPQSPFPIQNVPGFIPPVSTSMADSHLPLLITETRNQNTEIRMTLSKVTDKVDTILQKVDDLRMQGRASNANMPFMEGAILMQNIERIVQENAQLKEDIESKNSKIHSLNEKICDLFQRNQRFFEESSSMLEQRSDSLQAASVHSQEKILNLEQEKAKLQLELSSAIIKLNTLEADLVKYQKIESELHQKLLDSEREIKKQENVLNDTKQQLNDDQSVLSSLQEKLKSVENERSALIEKLEIMEQDLIKTHESSDSVEMYKKEIQQYKEKIEQMNSSIDANASVMQIDEKTKMELAENIKLNEEMQSKLKEMQKKLISVEELNASYEEKVKKLEAEVENFHVLKKKHEIFQEKTRAMKERYEEQIIELMNEIKRLQNVKSIGTTPDFSAEIKKVMNVLYKLLQGKFEPSTSYPGSEILQTVLQTIMGLTLQVLERKNQGSGNHPKSLVESSEAKNSPEPEIVNTQETNQAEISQPNCITEAPSEEAPSEQPFSNSISEVENTEENSENQLNVLESKETSQSIKEEQSSNNVETTNTESKSNVEVGEKVKSESPEIWRPQPPPLFDDDDDDDEDDDDWLK